MEVQKGAPCSVQIFTSRMRDEECLRVARIVDGCLKGVPNRGNRAVAEVSDHLHEANDRNDYRYCKGSKYAM